MTDHPLRDIFEQAIKDLRQDLTEPEQVTQLNRIEAQLLDKDICPECGSLNVTKVVAEDERTLYGESQKFTFPAYTCGSCELGWKDSQSEAAESEALYHLLCRAVKRLHVEKVEGMVEVLRAAVVAKYPAGTVHVDPPKDPVKGVWTIDIVADGTWLILGYWGRPDQWGLSKGGGEPGYGEGHEAVYAYFPFGEIMGLLP